MASDGKYAELPAEHADGMQTDDDAERGDDGKTDEKTAAPSTPRFRAYCFTDYELNVQFLKDLGAKARYLIAGLETCPTTGRRHYQSFIYFKDPKTVSAVRKILRPRHVEVCKGTPQENKDYCLKIKTQKPNEEVIEIGTLPKMGDRTDIIGATKALADGATMEEVAEALPEVYVKYHKGLEKWRELRLGKKRTQASEVIVLWGDAGTGKTRDAVGHGATLVDHVNNFFDNYDFNEVVAIDDFDHTTMTRRTFNMLTDRYDYRIKVKGSTMTWNPRVIYITSNNDPWEWYGGDTAVRRRLHRVYWYRKVGDEVVIDDQTPRYDELRRNLTAPSAEISQIVAPSQ